MNKNIFIFVIAGMILAGASIAAAGDGYGNHVGELKQLDIKVVYTNFFYRDGQGYAVYYIGGPMSCEIHVRNTGNRTFNRLDITAQHQYYESGVCDRWWYQNPRTVAFQKGQPLPGDTRRTWTELSLGPGEELVLSMTYSVPLETCDGLDQTCVSIKHTNNGGEMSALFYYNSDCGVFCPPPPAGGNK